MTALAEETRSTAVAARQRPCLRVALQADVLPGCHCGCPPVACLRHGLVGIRPALVGNVHPGWLIAGDGHRTDALRIHSHRIRGLRNCGSRWPPNCCGPDHLHGLGCAHSAQTVNGHRSQSRQDLALLSPCILPQHGEHSERHPSAPTGQLLPSQIPWLYFDLVTCRQAWAGQGKVPSHGGAGAVLACLVRSTSCHCLCLCVECPLPGAGKSSSATRLRCVFRLLAMAPLARPATTLCRNLRVLAWLQHQRARDTSIAQQTPTPCPG
mmetsp:Transcript_10755/g.19905  ORF Transcript_10755/g.19905 Transcript_10755/m.19905 type:complete len:267 (-) Transcript_10755:624-1424(-)